MNGTVLRGVELVQLKLLHRDALRSSAGGLASPARYQLTSPDCAGLRGQSARTGHVAKKLCQMRAGQRGCQEDQAHHWHPPYQLFAVYQRRPWICENVVGTRTERDRRPDAHGGLEQAFGVFIKLTNER